MIIVITGPTCTSKSKVALELAQKINAEIVNADAFQIYKELSIGTAKPSLEDFKKVKHHLYDFVDPQYNYSIFDYQKDARQCINNLIKQNKNIILVGGSGLYIRAALYDFVLYQNKNVDSEKKYEHFSTKELYEKLLKIDFQQAQKIHFNNKRRIIRALQIFDECQKTKTDLESMQKHEVIYDDVYVYAINMDRKKIYQKIDQRVDIMVSMGLVEEAQNLIKKYGTHVRSLKAIGYHEFIENNDLNIDDIIQNIKQNTKKYVRKQLTFIRHQYVNLKHFKWISPNVQEILDDIQQIKLNASN